MRWLVLALLLVGCSGGGEGGPTLLADYPEEEQAEVLAASMVDGVMWEEYWESWDVTFEFYYRSSDGSMCVVESGEVFECYETSTNSGDFFCTFDHYLRDRLYGGSKHHDATTTYVNLPSWPCGEPSDEADASTATDVVGE